MMEGGILSTRPCGTGPGAFEFRVAIERGQDLIVDLSDDRTTESVLSALLLQCLPFARTQLLVGDRFLFRNRRCHRGLLETLAELGRAAFVPSATSNHQPPDEEEETRTKPHPLRPSR